MSVLQIHATRYKMLYDITGYSYLDNCAVSPARIAY